MKDRDILAYVDGELAEAEEQAVETALRDVPSRADELALRCRDRLLLAEFLAEAALAADLVGFESDQVQPRAPDSCKPCHAAQFDILPNTEIFADYVGGYLSDQELVVVEEQLQSDLRFAREFAEFCRGRCLYAEAVAADATPLDALGSAARRRNDKDARSCCAEQGIRRPRDPKVFPPPRHRGVPWLRTAAILLVVLVGAGLLTALVRKHGGSKITGNPVPTPRALAVFESIAGDVALVRNGQETTAHTNVAVLDGDILCVGAGSAVLKYAGENTKIRIGSRTRIQLFLVADGKRVALYEGIASADVAEQPAATPMHIQTPQLLVTVLGTEFTLAASPGWTQIEVAKGAVNLVHDGTGASRVIRAGDYASASRQDLKAGKLNECAVVSFTLINAETRQAIPEFNPIQPDSTIRLSQLSTRNLTIRANAVPLFADQVNMQLQGPAGFANIARGERFYPYLLAGNNSRDNWSDGGIYAAIKPPLVPGTYKISATAYCGDESGRTATLSFSVSR